MKILVRNSELDNAISKVVKAVNTKNLGTAMEGILFKAKGDVLTLSATDMEIAIEKSIACDTFMEGEVLIPGKFISELVKNIDEEEEVEIYAVGNKVKITYGASVTDIQCLASEEFPIIKKDYNENSFTIFANDFKDAISKTVFACASDNARPIYCGALITIENDLMTVVALDGYRMAVCKKEVKNVVGKVKCVVPQRTLNEISRLIENGQDAITVRTEKNNLVLDLEGTVITSRLLEGDFIDYNRLIETNFLTSFTVNKALLKTCLDRASVVAKEAKNVIMTTVKQDAFLINAVSEIGQVNESVPINLNGEEKEIGFNYKNISDVLSVIDSDYVKFELNDSVKPCFIKQTENEDIIYMILPIRRNS